ncbi:GroES-like protein [Myriangium duriaei CBS 260.36]|uniref:GroES-like protein n=1 Tax=Myriangium duriaei CBS 260.36 TaxID=1168546 RepID=A0A9P4IYV3_9PEZI|nr:GroES-like protein [Myriangium duriaei CBS 260.36]
MGNLPSDTLSFNGNGIKSTPSHQPNPPLSTFSPNPALHTDQHNKVYIRDSPLPTPKETDCVIHVLCNGICGSDLHLWKSGGIGDLRVTHPYCLGHEGAGRIVWVGSRVTHLRLGDRVAIEPGVPCHECDQCGTGEYNLCPEVRFSGVPPHDGSMRRYHVHPGRYLHRIPEELSWADAALLEPLSVVMHALERSPVRLGEPVFVAGAGPIGLACAAAARASGATPLVITDVDEARLEFARRFVPGVRTVLVPLGEAPEQVAERVRRAFEGAGSPVPRVSFECTGVASSVATCVHTTARGGEVMVIGVGRSVMDGLPFMVASMAEVDLKFINRYHHSWPYAIRLMQAGYVDLKPLVTHRFRLEQAVEAIETSADRSLGSVKVHVDDEDFGVPGS